MLKIKKLGQLNRTVYVEFGDVFVLTIENEDGKSEKVCSENITLTKIISHWALIYVNEYPGYIIGDEKLEETLVNNGFVW